MSGRLFDQYGAIMAEDATVLEDALLRACQVGKGAVRVLEIGTHAGYTARGMKRFLEAQGRAIDYWGIDPGLLCPVADPFPGAHMVHGRSEWSFHLVPECFDLVFVDGNHARNAVILDTYNYAPKVVPGGMLVFHDTSPTMQGQDYQYEGPRIPEFHVAVNEALELIGFPWHPWRLVLDLYPTGDCDRCGARSYQRGA
jgi:hypothetical protein